MIREINIQKIMSMHHGIRVWQVESLFKKLEKNAPTKHIGSGDAIHRRTNDLANAGHWDQNQVPG